MAEIASWNGRKFTVSPALIRGFSGLSLRGSSDTEDLTSGGEKYASRKNSQPIELSLTAELSVFTGCDVRTEALAYITDAQNGATDYFYVGGKKVVACKLMLTDAAIADVSIAPNGTWTSCKVNLTLKQANTINPPPVVSSAPSSSSSGGGGAKKQQQALVEKAKLAIAQGVKFVTSIVKAAKVASTAKKITAVGSRIMKLRD